ncbi:MAG: pilus assembly protein PilM [Patescibacteria group bacterium]
MNLLKLISSEEIIGGLEIADDSLRFILLKNNKTEIETKLICEEKLSPKESLANLDLFLKKLSIFVKQNHIKYTIISLPADNIFLKLYKFPVAIPDEKISESMKLNIDLQLPKKKEDIYCDWMKLEKTETSQKVLLSYIKKDYAQKLFAIFKKAGVKIIAVETHALSLSRTIKQIPGEALLIVERSYDNTSFSVLENNNLVFLQNSPNEKISKNLNEEIEKIVNFHDWGDIVIKKLFLIGDFSEKETKNLPIKISSLKEEVEDKKQALDKKWLISLGAAKRGLIPRKDDNIISLMEIGTEKAYKQEKANISADFFMGISIALSIFFIAIFFTTWSFISMMQGNYNKRISSLSLLPGSENGVLLKEKADIFNNLISETKQLTQTEARWSKVIEEIKNKLSQDIKVSTLSLPSADGIFTITGTALNRESINSLKKSFESSNLFSDIDIPLNNLGKKNDIPFSMTFKIKDSQLIYTK